MATPRAITLLTDFGTADTYVGVMKGVVLGIAPRATFVDLTHEVPPQAVAIGAVLLARAARYFPPGTIHLAVVDPGVGTGRRAVAVEAGEQLFVGPDNGLLALAVAELGARRIVTLDDPRFHLPSPSATFHGRDVFAPAAAHLAAGVPLKRLGSRAARLAPLRRPAPVRRGDRLVGRVLFVDRFGNLVTTIGREHLERATIGRIRAGAFETARLDLTYGDARPGEPLAYIGSFDLLEIAVRDGSAAKALGLDRGARVEVEIR